MKVKPSQNFYPNIGLSLIGAMLASLPAQAIPSITVSPTVSANSLDLGGAGIAYVRIVKVADITLSTPNSAGLTLTISSGTMFKDADNTIPFQVTTVPDEVAASDGDFTVASGSTYTYVLTGTGSEHRDVYIRYSSEALEDPGNYLAPINLIVSDN